jgi:hypothetical protein
MKKTILLKGRGRFYYYILYTFLVLFISINGFSQQLQLSDFAIYVNPKTAKNQDIGFIKDNGVAIGANSKILSGSIGSYSSIKTLGPANIYGDVHSGGSIQLAWNNFIKGNITVAGKGNIYGKYAFEALNYFMLNGNLDTKGNINIHKNSAVNGKVIHPLNTSYNGPVPSNGEIKGTPSIPELPDNAPVTMFNPAGKTNIIKTQTITPGSYGQIKLSGNHTITFSGPGVYTFTSIKNIGEINKFIFDFAGSADGVFQIQVYGDVDLGKFQAVIKGGDASRIYAETHGNGSSCVFGKYAWYMDNCVIGKSDWRGTVYAPYAGINIGSLLGKSKVTGALWSGTKVQINTGVQIEVASF